MLVGSRTRWLPRVEAEQVVNKLLPNRDFSNSLYYGLIREGVLVENRHRTTNGFSDENVFIAYDRFADHIIAKVHLRNSLSKRSLPRFVQDRLMGMWRSLQLLVQMDLNITKHKAAFVSGTRFAFLQEKNAYIHHGLLEALCIQAPERTGYELARLAPGVSQLPTIGEAFLESIVWRKIDAFSQDTRTVLNELIRDEKMWGNPLDAFLSVATIPGHPFNADFLDQHLHQYAMPDRDSWWSTYLHSTWGATVLQIA